MRGKGEKNRRLVSKRNLIIRYIVVARYGFSKEIFPIPRTYRNNDLIHVINHDDEDISYIFIVFTLIQLLNIMKCILLWTFYIFVQVI